MPWCICTPSLNMIPFFVFQLWRKMLILYLYMNIEGRLWGHPVTSSNHHEKYPFLHNLGRSFHIWYQIEAACNILAFSKWPPFLRYSKLFFYRKRYWKLTIAEQCPTINAAFHIFGSVCVCVCGGGGGGGGGGIDIGIGDVTLVPCRKV